MPFSPIFTRIDTVFASAARTTHASSPAIQVSGYRSVTFDVDITAFSGTSITFTIEGFDHLKNGWFTLLASAALSATGHTRYTISPDGADTANSNLADCLPSQVRVTPSGTITSVTYSVAAVWSWN